MNRTKKIKSVKLHVTGSRLPAIVDIDIAANLKLNEKSWHLNTEGHVVANSPRESRRNGRFSLYLSRVVLGLYGSDENKYSMPLNPVRHINKDRLDCREENIVECSWQEIATTQKKLRSNNTSGYRGVHFHKASGKWHATIRPENKNKSLGYFVNISDAARAYDLAAIKYFGKDATINGGLMK